jgi:hypothetical protein
MTFKRGYTTDLHVNMPRNADYKFWRYWYGKSFSICVASEIAVLVVGYSATYVAMWMSRNAASSSECTKSAQFFRTTKCSECLVPVVSQQVQKYT